MKISIVLPVYNQERFLRDALESVGAQTYSDIEIVVVNDGSTDSSLRIATEYAKRDPRVKIVSQDNGGLLAANVTGIKAATGDYVCFYDPDDRIGPNFIASFVSEIDDNLDFVARGITYQYPDRSIDFPLKEDRVFTCDELRALSRNFILDPSMSMDNTIFVARWNKAYRTALLKSFVDKYAECVDVSLGEDSVFTYLLLRHAKKGKACVSPSSYCYVQHDESMTHAVDPERLLEKCNTTFEHFSRIIGDYDGDLTPARLLYCAQLTGGVANAVDTELPEAAGFYERIIASERFQDAIACAHRLTAGKNINIELLYRRVPYRLYRFARRAYLVLKK